jgi:hypothetical protein
VFFLQTNGSGVLSFAGVSASAGQVIQVVSTTKTDTFTTSSDSFVDVTGASVSITPSSASNKILVHCYIVLSATDANVGSFFRVLRGATAIGIGTASGSRVGVAGSYITKVIDENGSFGWHFLDTPATTSATTYKIQVFAQVGGYTATVGRTGEDDNDAWTGRFPTTITVMEIKG